MHSISDPSRVRFTGPLAPFAHVLREELARRGYTATSATVVVQFAAHLSRWLDERGVGLAGLTRPVLDDFLRVRRGCRTDHVSTRSLEPLLEWLRARGLVPPVPASPAPASPAEMMLTRYEGWLVHDRGISVAAARAYRRWVAPFAEEAAGAGLGAVGAGDVARFLTGRLPGLTRKTAQMTACSLRSFLRFGYDQGLMPVLLADAVPAVPHRRLAGLPDPLTGGQVVGLLAACDRATPAGLRDFAVITVFARLGLRCMELVGLGLDDVDWEAGVVFIRGKAGREGRLPLPVDAGEAVSDYLRRGRPLSPSRAVFLAARAPYGPLTRSGASCIVARAASRAGLGTVHAHRLRHTAASRTLNAGAAMEEVSHLLRHASPATTAIYAKTDQARLIALARPWPVSGGVS